jgi:hypothetical protein
MFMVVAGVVDASWLFKLLVGHGPEPSLKRVTRDGFARAQDPIFALA